MNIKGRFIEGVKSVEGNLGMALTSFACTLITLLFASGLPWYISLLFAVLTAPVAALTELYTKGGWDTVTVPISSALVLGLSLLFI